MAEAAGTPDSGSLSRSAARSRDTAGLEPSDQPHGLGLILGPIDGHRQRDHGVDPPRRVPTAGMGDPGAALRLLRDRGGDVRVEYRVAGMAQAAFEDRSRQPLRSREVTLPQLQRFVDRLAADGLAPATIVATITPLRAIYRRARQLGEAHANPTSGLSVPAVNRRQTRFATTEQVEAMLATLTEAADRALWATALYAGLRRGELQGLHREDVDLASGVIRFERGWDDFEGEVPPKSRQGRRKVPIPAALRDRLAEYVIDGPESGRIFAGVRDAYERGRAAAEAAGVEPPTLHECRHGYASLMIAAGVNVKALSTFMGHGTITITLDQYGHLLPGAEDEAAGLLDAFLARQVGGAELPTAPHPAESQS